MDGHVDIQAAENDSAVETAEPQAQPPQRMTRQQILTLISIASVNFSSMICYSILGPFFPNEAVKKGASQTVIGLIFGCYAVCNLIGSLIMGKYIVQIGAKFMLVMGIFVSSICTILFGVLNRVPAGPAFISLCFIVRSIDAVGFAAAMTSSFAMTAKIFPNNVATVLGSLEIFTGLGLILGPPLGGWFYQAFGYEVPFLILGCLLMLMVPFNIYVLPSIEATSSKDSFLRLLTKPKVVLICYVIFTLSAGLGFLDATLSLFAIDTFKLSPGSVGLIMLGLSLPYCLASPVLGFITDKYPATRSWFMIMGGTATAVGFCLLGPVPFLHISPLQHDVGPPFAAITASTLPGRLSKKLRSVFMGIFDHSSKSASLRSHTEVGREGPALSLIPKVFYQVEVRTLLLLLYITASAARHCTR